MYKASIRALLRHSISRLNQGDYSLMLKLAHPEFELAFPGDNSWSTMFRPAKPGRERHVTHRGVEEASAFADRFVAQGLQMQVEDIVVSGGPWRTMIAVRSQRGIGLGFFTRLASKGRRRGRAIGRRLGRRGSLRASATWARLGAL